MDVPNLIKSVKCRVAIWNRQHPQYKDRDCSLALWKEVASENGISVETARCKWRGLRDSYRIQLRKSILSEKNGVNQPLTWTYFDEMAFVKDQIYVDINRRKYWPEGSVKESAWKRNGQNSSSDEDEDFKDEVFKARSKISKTCDTEVFDLGSLGQAKVDFPIQSAIEHAIHSKTKTSSEATVNSVQLSSRIDEGGLSRNSENSEIRIKQENITDFCLPAELCTTEVTEDNETRLELDSATNEIDSTLQQSSDEDDCFSNAPLLQKKLKALQDDNYCFLMSILPQMKALPAQQKFLVRIKIQELLLAEVSNMENKMCRLESV